MFRKQLSFFYVSRNSKDSTPTRPPLPQSWPLRITNDSKIRSLQTETKIIGQRNEWEKISKYFFLRIKTTWKVYPLHVYYKFSITFCVFNRIFNKMINAIVKTIPDIWFWLEHILSNSLSIQKIFYLTVLSSTIPFISVNKIP